MTRPDDLYKAAYEEHGPRAQGVGWLDEEVQWRRFHALTTGIQFGISSILDVGCGYGELVEFYNQRRPAWFKHVYYRGIDVIPEYIDIARARHGVFHDLALPHLNMRVFNEVDVRALSPNITYDFVVGSGVLAYYDMPEKLEILDAMWELTGKVMAFNMTKKDATIRDLSMLLPRFGSGNWRVMHDYGLEDYTVVVKK